MNVNGHAIALWTGVGASLLGMAAGWQSVHSDISKQREEATSQAVQRQQRIDALNRRLEAIESHLEFIDETLPQHDKELARRIFAQVQLQVQQAQKIQPVMYERDAPVLAMRKMKKVDVPAVSADAIKKETPQ